MLLCCAVTAAQDAAATNAAASSGGGSGVTTPRAAGSSRSPSPTIPVELVAENVACGLCSGPVASSLLLTCTHLFCGDCICKHLQQKAECPTCHMALRAVPVR